MSRKDRITAAFSAAAATYDTAAEAQAIAAERLATLVRAQALPAAPRVLEIGCGTGLLTRRLLAGIEGGSFVITDLSPAMVEAARTNAADPRARFRVMDGEHPDQAEGGFDLVVSGLAAQWFADLSGALARLARLLAPGGRLLLSTLGAGSFAEWRRAHEALGLACGIPAYPGAADLAAHFPAGGRAEVREEAFQVIYPDARAFVGALKAIGAATPRPGHAPLSAGALRRVMAALGAPCPITYDVLYAVFTPGAA